MGEAKRKVLVVQSESSALDTVGGRIHVEWDPAAVTPLGQLPFFIGFFINFTVIFLSILENSVFPDSPLEHERHSPVRTTSWIEDAVVGEEGRPFAGRPASDS